MKFMSYPQSGSAGSQVASRNPYGQYYRARVTPDETPSTKRTAAWAAMATISAAWSGLTDAERLSWSDRVIMRRDALGQEYPMAPRARFIATNLLVFRNVGAFVQPTPPDVSGICVEGFAVSASVLSMPWTWTFLATPVSSKVSLWSTGPESAGVMRPPGRGKWWRQVWGADATSTQPQNAGLGWPFGVRVAGQRLWFLMQEIDFGALVVIERRIGPVIVT